MSAINHWVSTRPGVIGRASGEMGTRDSQGALFPDLLLFGTGGFGNLLFGWELKFPEVSPDDPEVVRNAARKANALNTHAFLVWNVVSARLHVRHESGSFQIAKRWELAERSLVRENVQHREHEWTALLHQILDDLTDFLASGRVRPAIVLDVLAAPGFAEFVLRNRELTARAIRAIAGHDARSGAELRRWWRSVGGTYQGESDPCGPAAGLVLSRWLSRVIFAHILSGINAAALPIRTLSDDTTLAQGLAFFRHLSANVDFAHLFAPAAWDEQLPLAAWTELIAINRLLGALRIAELDPGMIGAVLEQIIAEDKRKLLGQFVTPPWLASLMAHLALIDISSEAIDPCCGSGTIARALLQAKLSRGVASTDAASQVWASDKHPLSLHLATLAMAQMVPPGTTLQLFDSDIAELAPGTHIAFVNPNGGAPISALLPTFGAVASNLPFVRFEDVAEDSAALRDKVAALLDADTIGGRSDLYFYIALAIAPLLRESGRAALLFSNAWLLTESGIRFQEHLQRFFAIEAIIQSGAGRWFQNADVVVTLALLRRRDRSAVDDGLEETAFVTTLQPADELVEEDVQTIVDSIVLHESHPAVTVVNHVSAERLTELSTLGFGLNTGFADVSWLPAISRSLVGIGSAGTVARGERRGWDPMFYPETGHGIEREYLQPVLLTLHGVERLTIAADGEAFCCSLSLDELGARGHTGALAWIERFAHQVNGTGRLLPEVLRRPNKRWYEQSADKRAHIVTSMNPDRRLFFARLDKLSFVNQRGIALVVSDSRMLDLVHALLNCSLSLLYIEALGFGRGLGVLDLSATRIADRMRLLNPAHLSDVQVENIVASFTPLLSRDVQPIDFELLQPDRLRFEHILYEAFGIGDVGPKIRKALGQLYSIRKAVDR